MKMWQKRISLILAVVVVVVASLFLALESKECCLCSSFRYHAPCLVDLKTGEMIELIESGVPNIACVQPFACLPNHVTGKGMIKELRRQFPDSNIVAIDYDPGASEVNQLNRIKLMLAVAFENLEKQENIKSEKELTL